MSNISVLFFGADWCAPCQNVKPIVEPTVIKYADRGVKYEYKDCTANGSLAIQNGLLNARSISAVNALPTIIIVDNTTSRELGRIIGGFSSVELDTKINQALLAVTPTTPTTPTTQYDEEIYPNYHDTYSFELTPVSGAVIVLLGLLLARRIMKKQKSKLGKKPKKKKR